MLKLRTRNARPARAGTWMLLAALAVVLVDELVDGTKSAALPTMRHDLHLTYGQVGLLASVPLLLGGVLELPLGVLAGHGRRRRLAVLGGGVVFILALVTAAMARSFAGLLVAFVVFFPASGAFVSLTQSGLMDADPARREQHMARWELAGSVGSVTGPILLVVVLAAGGGWRSAYLALALGAVLAWLGVARNGPGPTPSPGPRQPAGQDPAGQDPAGQDPAGQDPAGQDPAGQDPAGQDPASLDPVGQAPAGQVPAGQVPAGQGPGHPKEAAAARREIGVLRGAGVLRRLALIELSNLLLDILTGFLALYLVDVVHATSAQAALGVAIRLGAWLAGDAAGIRVLEHVPGLTVLRPSVVAAALLYPAFLLVPGLWPKLVLLGCLSIVTAPWYTVLQAQLYGSLPGQSGVVVSLSSAASLVGGAAPLAVGLLAQHFGLSWALTSLAVAPLCLLGGLWRRPGAGPP